VRTPKTETRQKNSNTIYINTHAKCQTGASASLTVSWLACRWH